MLSIKLISMCNEACTKHTVCTGKLDRKFDREFDREFDRAFDRKFGRAFGRKFDIES